MLENFAVLRRAQQKLAGADIAVMRLDIGDARFRDARLLGRAERHLQPVDDLLRQVVLDGEYVGQVAIIALRPEMGAVVASMSCAVTRTRLAAWRMLPSRTKRTLSSRAMSLMSNLLPL